MLNLSNQRITQHVLQIDLLYLSYQLLELDIQIIIHQDLLRYIANDHAEECKSNEMPTQDHKLL